MRDYIAELRRLLAAHTADGNYHARTKAAEITEWLRENDPDLLTGFLNGIAEVAIWHEIADKDRSIRAHSRAVANRSIFRAAAIAAGHGDTGPIARFLDNKYVVEDGIRLRLADMRAPDLAYVAGTYENRARQNQFSAAFLRALERAVGNRTVGECFDESRLSALWRSTNLDRLNRQPTT